MKKYTVTGIVDGVSITLRIDAANKRQAKSTATTNYNMKVEVVEDFYRFKLEAEKEENIAKELYEKQIGRTDSPYIKKSGKTTVFIYA